MAARDHFLDVCMSIRRAGEADRLRGGGTVYRPGSSKPVEHEDSAAVWAGWSFPAGWGTRETLHVTLVDRQLVAEVGVDVARDSGGRWRHAARWHRVRPDVTPGRCLSRTRRAPECGAVSFLRYDDSRRTGGVRPVPGRRPGGVGYQLRMIRCGARVGRGSAPEP